MSPWAFTIKKHTYYLPGLASHSNPGFFYVLMDDHYDRIINSCNVILTITSTVRLDVDVDEARKK